MEAEPTAQYMTQLLTQMRLVRYTVNNKVLKMTPNSTPRHRLCLLLTPRHRLCLLNGAKIASPLQGEPERACTSKEKGWIHSKTLTLLTTLVFKMN